MKYSLAKILDAEKVVPVDMLCGHYSHASCNRVTLCLFCDIFLSNRSWAVVICRSTCIVALAFSFGRSFFFKFMVNLVFMSCLQLGDRRYTS